MKVEVKGNRLVNERGEIAVMCSRGYGAGWSSWSRCSEVCVPSVFDPDIAQLVLKRNELDTGEQDAKVAKEISNLTEEIQELARKKFGEDFYTGGADGLTVEWLTPGTLFQIDEYDGAEGIRLADKENWLRA